jgi:nucleoside-diphosphate-sugar epimerase
VEYNNAYEESKAQAERVVRSTCEAYKLEYRILRPSIVIGPSTTKRAGGSTTGLYGFLRELRKARSFLHRDGLDLAVPADPATKINLIPVNAVVGEMLRLHQEGFGEQVYHHLVNPRPPTAQQMMEVTCDIAEINRVRLVPDHEPVSPIERLLARRFEFYNSYWRDPKEFECRNLPDALVSVPDLELYMREAIREEEGNRIDSVLQRFALRTRESAATRSRPMTSVRSTSPAISISPVARSTSS